MWIELLRYIKKYLFFNCNNFLRKYKFLISLFIMCFMNSRGVQKLIVLQFIFEEWDNIELV